MSDNVSKVPASTVSMMTSLETRLAAAKMLAAGLIGLILGAVVGGLVFSVLGADTTATAYLRLQNPADLTAIAGGASQTTPDNQANTTTFVAGEIAYLSGDGFAQAVGEKMAESEPAVLIVEQEGESAVVTISNTAASDSEAIRTVQAAIDLYGSELAQRTDRQLRTIDRLMAQWQQRDAADAARMQELQRLRESVQLQAAAASTLLVVQPPTPEYPSSNRWVIGAALGAVLGAACAVAVVLARRRRAGRGALVRTLSDGVDGVLVPAVDLDGPASRARGTDEQIRLARTLFAQCPSLDTNQVIVVIGASSSSGGAAVSSLLETAAAEGQSLTPGSPPGGQHSSPASVAAQVVSGGVVGDPTLTPDLVRSATDIVLVARIDIDTAEQALALRSAAALGAAPVVTVFTYRRGLRAWLRRSPTQSPDPAG